MSAFGASTDKIMETGLGTSTASLASTQVALHHHTPTENRRLKIAAAVVFVLLALVAGAALVGIYLSQPVPPPEVFFIMLKDPEAHKPARIQVKFNKAEKVEYSMSPDVEKSGDKIYMLKDFSRGLVAHKDYRLQMCLVGRLNDTDDSAKQRAKAFKNKFIQVAATENFNILEGIIHREVLEFAAGNRITSYCNELDAYWLIPMVPSAPVPASNVQPVVNVETISVKPSAIEESGGEDEKMQILTDTNGNDDLPTQPDITPPDKERLQEIEDQVVLEEKLGVQASEKLETPEESMRDHHSHVPELKPLTDKTPSDREQKAFAGSFHERPTDGSSDSDFFVDRPRDSADASFAASERLEDRGHFTSEKQADDDIPEDAKTNLFTELSEEKTTPDMKNEDFQSTADEKSTVEKAPRIPAEEEREFIEKHQHSPLSAHLTKDDLVVEEKRAEQESNDSASVTHLQTEGDTNTRTSSAGNDDDTTTLSDHQNQRSSPDSMRRRRRQACTVRCWYFIRKTKGYRRCVHRCF